MMNSEARATVESYWQPTELVSKLLSKGARDVVGYWISQKRFLGENSQPRPLPLGSSEGQDFNSLISQVNPYLVPAVIANELLRKGIVEQQDNGSLLLRRSAYVRVRPGLADLPVKPRVSRLIFFADPLGQVTNG